MISVVRDTQRRGHVQVRARSRAHLDRLRTALHLEGFVVSRSPRGDYRYRASMSTEQWVGIARRLAAEVGNYANFKAESGRLRQEDDPDYVELLHRVWELCAEYQEKLESQRHVVKTLETNP
jgi:hypothetical protein